MQSRVIVTGEPLVFNDVVEQVKRPGGTFYDVDSEGTMRKVPESRADEDAGGDDGAGHVRGSRRRRRAGDERQRRVLGGSRRTPQGLVAQMAAAVRNARLQKERARLAAAEAAARATAAEREEAANVLEAVGDGIFLVDRDGCVRLWNHAATLVTGLRAERVRGKPVREAFPDWPALETRSRSRATAPRPRRRRSPCSGPAGLWLSFVAVRSADGSSTRSAT